MAVRYLDLNSIRALFFRNQSCKMPCQVQPVYLVSVNNTPQRAKELVAILIEVDHNF